MALAYSLAALIAFLGYRARALSLDGAIAAAIVGGTILGFGGWAWAILLTLFFLSSTLLSFFKGSDARKLRAAETFDKGGRRDAAQVLANGGTGALLAFLSIFVEPNITAILFCAYAGSLAAATADTWATEIGVLSRCPPRMITSLKPVLPGTSGGITLLGSSASLAGALFIGAAAALLSATLLYSAQQGNSAHLLLLLASGIVGGTLGSLLDSLLGATIQASYLCPQCNKPTESRVHKCGTQTTLERGMHWITNDVVNLVATIAGALSGGALCAVLYN